jgi:hypothetical protein
MDTPTPASPSNVASDIPIVSIRDAATPRIALTNTKTRKVMCRGLTPKNKNIEANTLSVLIAMQARPPFVSVGRKAVAWDSVANLARRNPDLIHVTGALCEGRYKEVRKSYQASKAASRRASGVAENPPTEQDSILEELIALEDDFLKKQEQANQENAQATATREQSQAIALDIREAACERLDRADDPVDSTVASESAEPDVARRRRKRKNDVTTDVEETIIQTGALMQRALKKWLGEE